MISYCRIRFITNLEKTCVASLNHSGPSRAPYGPLFVTSFGSLLSKSMMMVVGDDDSIPRSARRLEVSLLGCPGSGGTLHSACHTGVLEPFVSMACLVEFVCCSGGTTPRWVCRLLACYAQKSYAIFILPVMGSSFGIANVFFIAYRQQQAATSTHMQTK